MNITIRKKASPLAKAFKESLNSIEAEIEVSKLSIVEELLQFMKREGINRSELAQRMGVGSSRITAMLSGDGNLTIDTLVRAGRACNVRLHQHFVPVGYAAHFSSYHEDEIHEAFAITARKIELNPVKFNMGPEAKEDNAHAA
jgi:transcriptional regulator with XRE-family HTH domain